jgi:hypothetical protein
MIVAVDILSSLPNCPTSCSRVERCLERTIKLLSAKNSESPSETRILPWWVKHMYEESASG